MLYLGNNYREEEYVLSDIGESGVVRQWEKITYPKYGAEFFFRYSGSRISPFCKIGQGYLPDRRRCGRFLVQFACGFVRRGSDEVRTDAVDLEEGSGGLAVTSRTQAPAPGRRSLSVGWRGHCTTSAAPVSSSILVGEPVRNIANKRNNAKKSVQTAREI